MADITAWAASFKPNDSRESFYFNCLLTEGGRAADVIRKVLEELQSNGVDGRRWRVRFRQYPAFTAETLCDTPTHERARELAAAYEAAEGGFGKLSIKYASGSPRTYANVKVDSVMAQARGGGVGGFASSATSTAHVVARWTFILTEGAS